MKFSKHCKYYTYETNQMQTFSESYYENGVAVDQPLSILIRKPLDNDESFKIDCAINIIDFYEIKVDLHAYGYNLAILIIRFWIIIHFQPDNPLPTKFFGTVTLGSDTGALSHQHSEESDR